jgi:hypothetical protein
MTTRRELLALGSMAGVGMLIPAAAEATRPLAEIPGALVHDSAPTREQLLAQVDTPFVVRSENGDEVTLVLVEVSDPTLSGRRRRPGSFRVLFRGPEGAELGQDTYAVTSASLGEFSLFLVPMGRTARTAPLYEASFNRL